MLLYQILRAKRLRAKRLRAKRLRAIAGGSAMTVSRELRNARHVSSGKRERVLAAPSALD